jgi:tRNA G18 (ribose-2'-O)-methylase SpoU
MVAGVQSLNAAMATGVILFEVMRQRTEEAEKRHDAA